MLRSNRAVANWRSQLEAALSPFDEVPPDDRHRARLLTAIILVLGCTFVPFSMIWMIATGFATWSVIIAVLAYAALGAGYFVSRTKRFEIASWMLISTLMIALVISFWVGYYEGTSPVMLVKYLALGLMLASLTLSIRVMLSIAIFFFVLVFFLTAVLLQIPTPAIVNEMVFYTLIAGALIGSAVLRQNYIQQLKVGEGRYRALFEQSNDAVFILNLQGEHEAANQRAAKMLGYTVEELHYLSFRDVVMPAEHSNSANVLQRLLAGEKILPYERLFRRKDGVPVPVEVNVELVRDAEGKPSYIQSVAREISTRKRAEYELMRLRLEHERGQILTTFIRGATHEFRTPLSTIATSVYLLGKEGADPAVRARRLGMIQQQTDRVNQLVDVMLLMVKLDSGEPFSADLIRLNELLTDLLRPLEGKWSAKSMKVSMAFEPTLPLVRGDPRYLAHALRLIVQNAIQYTPTNGRIDLRTFVDDQRVVVEVADSGMGIAPENKERIFERFFRADDAHSTEGFGLGLSIARTIIVERHNGQITVESTLGVGSIFRVILPAASKLPDAIKDTQTLPTLPPLG